MRIVCQQTILMNYHALFVILKKQQNLKLSSAANYRWRFKWHLGLVTRKPNFVECKQQSRSLISAFVFSALVCIITHHHRYSQVSVAEQTGLSLTCSAANPEDTFFATWPSHHSFVLLIFCGCSNLSIFKLKDNHCVP